MKIIELNSPATERKFIDFPKWLYRNDPTWVCPIDAEVRSIFNPDSNRTFAHGEATRWILVDENGSTIGRVAAFVDYTRSSKQNQPTGGMGFFEVIESREAAFMLFDTAVKWLSAKGMEATDGPINFGENLTNWGLLVDGFTHPAVGMPYNMRYYQGLFEEYGFRNYFEQYSYHRDLTSVEVFPERFMKIAEWIAKRPGYTFSHFTYNQTSKYVNDLIEIYNITWAAYKGDFTPIATETLTSILSSSRAFIDEELIWYAYHNYKPVAFFVIFPDVNMILRHFRGRLHPWNILRFLWYKNTHEMTRMRALVAGVIPSYQNSGIESAIFYHLYKVFRKKRFYKELELSWVGDYNPKMISMYEAIGAQKAKTHITYRYMINKAIPFRRFVEEEAMHKSSDHIETETK